MKKSTLIISMILAIFFSACGGGSGSGDKIVNYDSENDERVDYDDENSKKILLVKSTTFDKDSEKEIMGQTYQYDSNHNRIGYTHISPESNVTCNFIYDNQYRPKNIKCNYVTTNRRYEVETKNYFNDDKWTRKERYEDGELVSSEKALSWDDDGNPTKTEWKIFNSNIELTTTANYVKDNIIHVETISKSDENIISEIIDNKYDNKNAPCMANGNKKTPCIVSDGNNNIIKTTTTITTTTNNFVINSKRITENRITFNEDDFPSRIDTTIIDYINGAEEHKSSYYTIYEYQ